MARTTDLADLPETLAIFPLSGALLLPRGRLPLNIFEPRYLQMVDDALSNRRLIGMIQPTEHEDQSVNPPLYGTGCAGRIVGFAETDDDRYLITLAGLCRFGVAEELAVDTLYRRVRAAFRSFGDDLAEPPDDAIDRTRLINAVRAYASVNPVEVDWDAAKTLSDDALVTSLAMGCSFGVNEKQALLEAPDLVERARTLTALLEMAALGGDAPAPTQ